jgi:3-deoxy-D-manno-octulosonic-acid transferase
MKKPPINLRLLIAPHEIDQQRIGQLEKEFGKGALRLSKANPESAREARVLIVDNVGMLSQLYRYGHYAYIGGGFGVGTHNILEAATFGLPLFFGPNHQKFRETIDLIRLRGAFPVSTVACFLSIFEKVASDDYIYQQAHMACLDYIARNTGATEIIMTGLKRYLQEE